MASIPPLLTKPLFLPLSLARALKLSLIDEEDSGTGTGAGSLDTPFLLTTKLRNLTPTQLRSDVSCNRPSNLRFMKLNYEADERLPQTKYVVYDVDKESEMVFVIGEKDGKCYEEYIIDEDDPDEAGSIKLGLGDFIFYSVLVSKAATYSFTTFISCVLVILFGLGATLLLLSLFKAALPALPISIFLGVFTYAIVRVSVEPWVEGVLSLPMYV